MKCTTSYVRLNKSYKAGVTTQCSLLERKLFLYGNLLLSDVASHIQKSIHSTHSQQSKQKLKKKKLKTLSEEYHSLRDPQLLHFTT